MIDDDNPLGITEFDAAEYLDSEEAIAEFLNESLAMNDTAVLIHALGVVARARGMAKLAGDAGLSRESLYKTLRPGAHPRIETLMKVMTALNIGLRTVPLTTPRTESARPASRKPAKKVAASAKKVASKRAARSEARANASR